MNNINFIIRTVPKSETALNLTGDKYLREVVFLQAHERESALRAMVLVLWPGWLSGQLDGHHLF